MMVSDEMIRCAPGKWIAWMNSGTDEIEYGVGNLQVKNSLFF